MNMSATPFSSHQAIMKCPWQWRQPFLDEKRESRKRKVGDGYFYDPVDPNFVDHLLPGYAKKFCGADVLESDEKENIQREIERLMTKKDGTLADDDAPTSSDEENFDVSRENQALVDSILLMSKSVEASSLTLLASPKSVASSSPSSDEGSDDDELATDSSSGEESFDLAEDRPAKLIAHRSSSLELVSDNLQEAYFAVEDNELLDFQAVSTTGAVETD